MDREREEKIILFDSKREDNDDNLVYMVKQKTGKTHSF